MTDPTESIFAQGLAYEGALPVEWRPRSEPYTPTELEQLNVANERILRLLTALEEQHHPELLDEHGTGHELARVELKVNLLLDLVSQLLVRQQTLPPATAIRLNGLGVQWRQPAGTPAPGGTGEVVIYLNPELPSPLRLPAVIHAAAEQVEAHFQGLSDALVDVLEKMIFRHHRRQVAQSRPSRDG